MFSVARGRARVSASTSDIALSAGDTAHYRADVPHAIHCEGSETLEGYLIVSYR